MRDSKFPFIFRGEFLRNSAILLFGAVASQGLLLLTSPLLTRIYTQADFGTFAVFLSSVSILSTIITLRYEFAIVTQPTSTSALQALKATLFITILLGITLLIIILLIWELGIFPESWPLSTVLFSVIAGTCSAQFSTLNSWWNRRKAVKQIAILKLLQSTLIAVISLSLGYLGWRHGLWLGQTAGVVIVLLLCSKLIYRLDIMSNLPRHASILRKNINSPKYLLLAAFIDMLSLQLPVYLITFFFSTTESGEYSLAWRVLAAPVSLISVSFGQVFFQKISTINITQNNIKPILSNSWILLFSVGLIPFLMLLVFGQEIFSWLFGEKWHHAGLFASIMAPMLFGMFISSPTSTFYFVIGLQKYSPFFSTSSLIYRTAAIFLGYKINSIEVALWLLTCFELLQIASYNIFGFLKIKNLKK